jgi:hypothetical protein
VARKSCTYGETSMLNLSFQRYKQLSAETYLTRRCDETYQFSSDMQNSPSQVTSNELVEGNEKAPNRTERTICVNTGSPTGRETYGDGTPIVGSTGKYERRGNLRREIRACL